ncbi:LysM peptidoglycan-binding domain-containing protein [Limosilactobacillus mucosae]|uniref:LysM peptidoglycan-binding domain-containing protein n=1 Tax=Limosilactobacillus mucosae TaxID=97478 RepID=A0AAJ1HR18_LIMMU|nr:LysM peptidoglycan-binding domain-containing protein [Limosilactobacillus mucosae]MDC2828967.1 LysM peptidoglycan-binding domain-containing protein [Limosilactobacillus mucosae]
MDRKNFAKLATGSLLGAALVCGSALMTANNASASTWHANSPESIQIVKGQKVYTVKYGDTLWAISVKTNIKIATLAKASGITNPDFIQVGQKIILSGNNLTVEDSNGNVVGQAKLKNSDKVVKSQSFGTPVTAQAAASQTVSVTVPNTNSSAATIVPNTPVAPASNASASETPAAPVTPDQGTMPTTPDQGTTTPTTPDQGTTTPTNPDQGTTTPTNPDQGTTTPTTPDQGTTTPTNPDQGSTTPTNPDQGTTTPTNPDQGSTTPTTPDSSYLTDPSNPNSFMTDEGISKARSIAEDQINEIRTNVGLEAVDFSNEVLQNAANKRAEQAAAYFEANDAYDNHKEFKSVMAEVSDELESQDLVLVNYGECESMAVIKMGENTPEKVGVESIKLLTTDKPHYDILTTEEFNNAAVSIKKVTTKKYGDIYLVVVDFADISDID